MENIKCNKCGNEKIKVKYCTNCKTVVRIKDNIAVDDPGICNKCNEKRVFSYYCSECKTVNKIHKESKVKSVKEKKKTGLSFIGKICPYCKTEFKEDDDVVVCSVCEMPHHKECWIENKACTTFGCTGTIVGAEQYAEAVDNKTFCSKCGATMNEGQKFCASCGTPAGTTGEPHFQVAGAYTANQSYQQNTYTAPQPQYATPYSAPQYNAGYNPYGQQQQQVDQDLYTFIQSNQSFYISKFQKMQMSNSKTSWNWCSFLFSAYWLAYRKMYGIAAAYAGISFVLGLIPGLGAILGLAMSICAGIFGNHFYKQYINGELQVASSMDAMNKNAYIAKKGGTSTGAVFAVLGIMFVLGMIIGSSM